MYTLQLFKTLNKTHGGALYLEKLEAKAINNS